MHKRHDSHNRKLCKVCVRNASGTLFEGTFVAYVPLLRFFRLMPVRRVALDASVVVVVMPHSAVSLKFGTRDVHAYELPEEKHHRVHDKLQVSDDIATALAPLSLNFELFIKKQG